MPVITERGGLNPATGNPDEIATLTLSATTTPGYVGGVSDPQGRLQRGRFDDWESVWVQHRYAEECPEFRFTAVERDPLPPFWSKAQIVPGDECAIYLGKYLAVTGVILIRQVAYDANSHGIQFQGVGIQWYGARSSIIDKTGSYDNMTFKQIAEKVLAPTGIKPKYVPDGSPLNPIPFKRAQNEPGETVWAFLERLARVRGIVMGSDNEGHMLFIYDHSYPISAELIEGYNILKCQCIISEYDARFEYIARAQTAADDSQYGAKAAEKEARVKGSAKRYMPLLVPVEQPVWGDGELRDRAKNEMIWNEGTWVECNITVQGWYRPDGKDLWRAGDFYHVKSPMAMINTTLAAQTVTFTQDSSSGTLTLLQLVRPSKLKGKEDALESGPTMKPLPDGQPTTNNDPAQTPPAVKPADPPPPTLNPDNAPPSAP